MYLVQELSRDQVTLHLSDCPSMHEDYPSKDFDDKILEVFGA
jgi:hypothetical protein